jgi:hypothetical protein
MRNVLNFAMRENQYKNLTSSTFEGAEVTLAWRSRDDDLACGEEGVAGLEPRFACGRWRMMRQATEMIRAAISRAAEGDRGDAVRRQRGFITIASQD